MANGEKWNIGGAPQWVQILAWGIQQVGVAGVISLALVGSMVGLLPNPILDKVVENQARIIKAQLDHDKATADFRPVFTRLIADSINRQNRILRIICMQGARTEELKNQCNLYD